MAPCVNCSEALMTALAVGQPSPSTPRMRWPLGVGVVSATVALSGSATLWSSGPVRAQAAISLWLVVTAVVAGLLVARVARNPVGWLLAALALCVSGQGFALALAEKLGEGRSFQVAAWVSHWIAVPGFGSLAFIALLFPDGRAPSRRWRWPGWVLALGLGAMVVATALAPAPVSDLGIDNPLAWERASGLMLALLVPAHIVVSIGAVGAIASLVVRFRRSVGDERQQLKWCLFGIGVLVVTLVFAGLASGPVNELSFVLALVGLTGVPVVIGIAVLEYHLYDIDQVINRALVYGTLTLVVVALYVAVVGFVSVVFDRALGVAASLVATALVAVVLQPVRARLQRIVDRLVYGQRNDPSAAIGTLAQQLRDVPDPSTLPRQIVGTVSSAMKLPYVAVELEQRPGGSVSVEHGRRTGRVERIPIRWQDEPVGELLVGGDSRLRPGDRRLLFDLAGQAAPALAAVRLDRELERSRQQLVIAREEERRRLRGDLHDGLGPQLAGLAMGLDAVSNLLDRDPAAAREAVAQIRQRSHQALETVRAVSRGLRPPVLDDLGLVSAVRQHAKSLATAKHRVEVVAEGEFGSLPAAAELAAYHIALEATTNAARHANATRTQVHFELRAGALEVEVTDDGGGLPAGYRAGVGLRSMRDRAEELGGSLTVTGVVPRGTAVLAVLPVTAP